MPHSVSPESTPAEDVSTNESQVDAVKAEPETQDVSMEYAAEPTAAENPKVNLEDLFDDEDSDEEFPSSAPVPTSQEDASQPAPMYAPHTPPLHAARQSLTHTQQDHIQILLLRPRRDARLLPAPLPLPPTLPMAEPLANTVQRLRAPRIRLHAAQRCIPTLPILRDGRSSPKTMRPNAALAFRNRPYVQHKSAR